MLLKVLASSILHVWKANKLVIEAVAVPQCRLSDGKPFSLAIK